MAYGTLSTDAQRQVYPPAHIHTPQFLPGETPKSEMSRVTLPAAHQPLLEQPPGPVCLPRCPGDALPSQPGLVQHGYALVQHLSFLVLGLWQEQLRLGEEEGVAKGVKHPLFFY